MRQRGRAGRKEYRVESPGQQDRKENDTIKNEKRDRRGGRRQESEGGEEMRRRGREAERHISMDEEE